MKRLALILLASTALASPGYAQSTGVESPDWQKIPGGQAYDGCLTLPLSVVGGCMGVGSINAYAYYLNGQPLFGVGSLVMGIPNGGTGATTAAGARANLGAAASGVNSDITQLTGLTTPLSISQGGTGASNAIAALANLGAAANGANVDITSLGGLTTPLSVTQGGTGANNPAGARTGIGAAASGPNTDITSLLGLTTPLAIYQGGTGATTAAQALANLGVQVFYAKNYGNCTWDATHDVVPCINLAIAAALANNGGAIVIPPHPETTWFGAATYLTPVNNPAISFIGAGVGQMPNRTTALPVCSTRLRWIGPVSAGPLLDIEAVDPVSLYGNNVKGICFDGAYSLHTIARIASVGYVGFDFTVMNRLEIGVDLSTIPSSTNSGTQYAVGNIYDYCDTNSANWADQSIGLLVRSDYGSQPDVSLNQFGSFVSNCGAGNPAVMINGDTNKWFAWVTYRGGPIILANSNYQLPLGLKARTSYPFESLDVERYFAPIWVQGIQSGSTITATSVKGTASPTTVPFTTAATNYESVGLNVVSSAGLAPGFVVNLNGGGNASWAAGIMPNSPIRVVPTATQIRFNQWVPYNVAAGVQGVASWGFTSSASPGYGPYTMTYVAATNSYSLTAPARGNSQTGIQPTAISGGGYELAFQDIVIPWYPGTPQDGDTWSISTPANSPGFFHAWRVMEQRNAWIVPPPQWEMTPPSRGGCWGDETGPPCEYSAPNFTRIIGDPTLPNTQMSLSPAGFVPPQYATGPRLLISNPVLGGFVYDTTANAYYYWNGTAWEMLGAGTTVPGGTNGQVQYNASGAFTGWGNSSINATTGAATITFPNAATNSIYYNMTMADPTTELRPFNYSYIVHLTTGNNGNAIQGITSTGIMDPGPYAWQASGHNSAFLSALSLRSSTPWYKGCTVGTDCPGSVRGMVAFDGQVDMAVTGVGELQKADTVLVHTPAVSAQGGVIDLSLGVDSDGCLSGVVAAQCMIFNVPNTIQYAGFDTLQPIANWHVRGIDDAAQTINGYITGSTMCLDTRFSGAGYTPWAAVTGAGVPTGVYLVGFARGDIPNGYFCYTINQTLSTNIPDGTPLTITPAWHGYMSENESANINLSEAGYYTAIGRGLNLGFDAGLVERFDTVNTPWQLAKYMALNLIGDDIVYFYSANDAPASPRPDGIAVGYGLGGPVNGTLPAINDQYNITAKASINSDGEYYQAGTPGVSCTSNSAVTTQKGIVTACGGHAVVSPGYVASGAGGGTWYGNLLEVTAPVTSTTGTANYYYCSPYQVTATITIGAIGVRVITPSSGNSNAALAGAIFNNRGTAGAWRPGSLIDFGATPFNTSVAGAVSVPLNNTSDQLQPGLYWTCMQKFDTVAQFGAINPSTTTIVGIVGTTILANALGPTPATGVYTTGTTFNSWSDFLVSTSWVENTASAGAPVMALQVVSSP